MGQGIKDESHLVIRQSASLQTDGFQSAVDGKSLAQFFHNNGAIARTCWQCVSLFAIDCFFGSLAGFVFLAESFLFDRIVVFVFSFFVDEPKAGPPPLTFKQIVQAVEQG